MIYRKNGRVVDEARARRIVAAAVTKLDGFYDQDEADKMWRQAHEQSSTGYWVRNVLEDIVNHTPDQHFTMRHPNEEGGQA